MTVAEVTPATVDPGMLVRKMPIIAAVPACAGVTAGGHPRIRPPPLGSSIVTEADLERQLAIVRAAAAGGAAGIFGPDSVTWRIDREAATFLGAGRALLLQLAHLHPVEHLVRVAAVHPGEARLRQGGLDVHHQRHGLLRGGGVVPEQLENPHHVLAVLLADLL